MVLSTIDFFKYVRPDTKDQIKDSGCTFDCDDSGGKDDDGAFCCYLFSGYESGHANSGDCERLASLLCHDTNNALYQIILYFCASLLTLFLPSFECCFGRTDADGEYPDEYTDAELGEGQLWYQG